MGHIIDIDGEGFFLTIKNSCLSANKNNQQVLSIHPSDVDSIICHGNSQSLSSAFISTCGEYNIPIVFCDTKHLPLSITVPFNQHSKTYERYNIQIKASEPCKKQIWKLIIKEKINNQANHLKFYNKNHAYTELVRLSEMVKSGDTSNCEAQAAKIYFHNLFEYPFKRHTEDLTNIILNYLYTIIRSCIARQVVGAGLNPFFSVFHSNKSNSFALIDDLIEIYRPLADRYAILILNKYKEAEYITPEIKRDCIKITTHILTFLNQEQDFQIAIKNYIYSYISILNKSGNKLIFPKYNYDFTL